MNPEVLEALQRAGLPVPTPERVDRIGFSAVEVRAIERHRRNTRPDHPIPEA